MSQGDGDNMVQSVSFYDIDEDVNSEACQQEHQNYEPLYTVTYERFSCSFGKPNFVMWINYLWNFLVAESNKLIEWAKCGDDYLSTVPTALWAIGASAFAHRLLETMFRRFMFRRVALWEQILQHLLFVWMVMYSLHFWHVLVRLIKLFIEYYDEDSEVLLDEEKLASLSIMQQWVIWVCGATPLAVYIYTRPQPAAPPLMIWITTSPWQRREMGPYGYYLNRPFSTLQSFTNLSLQERTLTLRRAISDSKIIIKEPLKRRRYPKSI